MTGIDVYPDSDAFWTRMCGIYRHSASMWSDYRPGTYKVMMSGIQVMNDINFFANGRADHQNAVCDDFGNLVRVQ